MGFFRRLFGKDNSPQTPDLEKPSANEIPNIPAPSPELAQHIKTAWVWILSTGEGATDSTRTGGRPIMGENEVWPKCGDCHNPLSFMMQSNLDALPEGMANHESGILRFFYCLHDDCAGMGGWDAFDPQHHLSLLQDYGNSRKPPKGAEIIPPQFVSDFKEIEDLPHWPDRTDINLPASDDDVHAMPGHKYAGWPFWIQGAERPNCPDCKATMEPFIQLDSNWNRSFNFGGGIGHISQCKTHTDRFAFGWACD